MSELPARPGILTRWLLSFASKRQRRELETFVGVLAELNALEMSDLLLLTIMVRRGMEEKGLTPMDPVTLVLLQLPGASTAMAAQSEQFNRKGSVLPAAACTVWGHTFRAALDRNLQPSARMMWREVMRGLPHLETAQAKAKERDGITVDITDAGQIPSGMG